MTDIVPTTGFKLSVLVPVYNERDTVGELLRQLVKLNLPCPWDAVVVDDGSDDGTDLVLSCAIDPRISVLRHERNLGRGAAVRTAIAAADGTHIVLLDADGEYDVADIPKLMRVVLDDGIDVVYGARIPGINTRYTSLAYPVGAWATTWLANLLYDARLRDMHTCLKLLPLDLVRQLPLVENRFGFDTEVTARMLKMGIRPYEVPISYRARSRAAGKKLTWRDGIGCVSVLVRYRFSRRASASLPPGCTVRPTG